MKRSLRAIERAFADIENLFTGLIDRVRVAESGTGRKLKESGKPRRLRITPKRRAQLKLQGAYMGFMRQRGPRQQARVRAVKEKRGFEAANSVAESMTGKLMADEHPSGALTGQLG